MARLLNDVREMTLCQGYTRNGDGAGTHSDACTGVCLTGNVCAPCTRASNQQKRHSSILTADTESPGEAYLVSSGSHRPINTLSQEDLKVRYRDLRRKYKATVMREHRLKERTRNESAAEGMVSVNDDLLNVAKCLVICTTVSR